jgi:predicted membrane-bound spermidine synthase
MPEWADGAWTDPRAEYHYEDAHAFIKADDRMYDVIIMDIADPIEAGPGICLYTEEFYKFAATRLSPGGVLVTQSGPGGMANAHECFSTIHQTLRTAFDVVVPYTADVASFGSNWGFNLAFNMPGSEHTVPTGFEATGEDRAVKAGEAGVAAQQAVTTKPCAEVDALIEERIAGGADALEFLDGVSWHGIMGIPKQVRKCLREEERHMSVANPVFMY